MLLKQNQLHKEMIIYRKDVDKMQKVIVAGAFPSRLEVYRFIGKQDQAVDTEVINCVNQGMLDK